LDILVTTATLALAAVFFLSGASKLADLRGMRQALRDFGVPASYTGTLGVLLPPGELLLVGLLIVPVTRLAGSIVAIGLLAMFSFAIVVNLSRGRSPDCRCFGQIHSAPISGRTLGRNAGLTLLALAVVADGLGGGSATSNPVLNALIAGSVVAGALAVVVFELALPLGSSQGSVPAPETSGLTAGQVVQLSMSQPLRETLVSHLRTGVAAPAFQLPDAAGLDVSLAELTRTGNPVVLIFIDPECDMCDSILPDVARWQRTHGAVVTLQLIGSGPMELNRVKAARFGISGILVQEDWEVADAYGSDTVPSAILVRPDGTIGSRVADGPDEVLALLNQFADDPAIAWSA
jgi:hypothetical protein